MKSRKWTILLLLAGIACIGVGLARHETFFVLRKAAAVCLECIGIG